MHLLCPSKPVKAKAFFTRTLKQKTLETADDISQAFRDLNSSYRQNN